jgi:hypothetical protein
MLRERQTLVHDHILSRETRRAVLEEVRPV